jgi:hypothetical protein
MNYKKSGEDEMGKWGIIPKRFAYNHDVDMHMIQVLHLCLYQLNKDECVSNLA